MVLIVFVKGKTDTNRKPFERQKRSDDERLTNASRVYQPCEQMSRNFERTGKPFECFVNPLISRVKLWVIQSLLTFDSMDPTCDHSLESY